MNPIPKTIAQFIDASNRYDIDQMARCFADDATVHDVGEDLQLTGRSSIRQWLEDTRGKYSLQTRPLETSGDDENFEILAEVSGTFDGSPLKFRYRFNLQGESIRFLSTTYVDE